MPIPTNYDGWTEWPPEGAANRRENYERYREMFKGRHDEVFKRVQDIMGSKKDKSVIYIVCNFAGLLSKTCADFLFGEHLQFKASNDEVQKRLEAISENNRLHTTNYEMGLCNSWRGDAIYKVRWGRPKEQSVRQAIIEPVNPACYFPRLNNDNAQEASGCTLAWVREFEGDQYLRCEIHRPGKIYNELYLLKGSEIKAQVPLDRIPDYEELKEEEDTGYEGTLVMHVPNYRLDDEFFGISDYQDIEGLFDEMNNRISRMAQILDKHSDPKLILPPGMMKYDPKTNQYYIEKEDLQCLEIDPGYMSEGVQNNLPRYLVWDAQLDAAFQEIDKLLEMIMMVSETPPAIFGLEKYGVAESGRAMKFRLLRAIAKSNRKALYFTEALQEALYAAQVMENENGGESYTPEWPTIEWPDGIPKDMMEQAKIEQVRQAAGLSSKEAAIRRLDGLTGQALEDELNNIEQAEGQETVENPEGE